jgi:hypothetical protein
MVPSASCPDKSTDAGCTLQGNCSSNYETLQNFNFKVNFTTSDNYLRVPLWTFADDAGSMCNIMVQNLNSATKMGTSTIIFGGMFYEEFYGKFVN